MNNLASFFFYLQKELNLIKNIGKENKVMLDLFYNEFEAKGKYNSYSRVKYNKNNLLLDYQNELNTYFNKK